MKRLALTLLAASLLAVPAEAIPAFARKYNITCMTCHDPIPHLTTFGERFAALGYVLAADDTTGMTSLGDPLLALNNSLPVAIRFDAYARYVRTRGGGTGRTDFAAPMLVKLLTGGQIARGVSYYIYLLLAEDGVTGPLEDAWVMFRQPAGIPADITVGQFQIIDPLWKRELRITLEDYVILSQRIGSGAANLTYDRGVMIGVAPSERTAIFVEIVNGNGIDPAPSGRFDGDAPKTGVLIATHDIGPLRIGALGYYGQQRLMPGGGGGYIENRTRMAGPALQTRSGNVDLGAQWVYRDDTDPTFLGVGAHTVTRGGFAEVHWWPTGRGSRALITGLYNDVRTPGADYRSLTLNASWLYMRNTRLSLAGTYEFEGRTTGIGAGIVTAF
jgi:hypothetical protein